MLGNNRSETLRWVLRVDADPNSDSRICTVAAPVLRGKKNATGNEELCVLLGSLTDTPTGSVTCAHLDTTEIVDSDWLADFHTTITPSSVICEHWLQTPALHESFLSRVLNSFRVEWHPTDQRAPDAVGVMYLSFPRVILGGGKPLPVYSKVLEAFGIF